jgi:hypothetical protein
MPARTPDVLGNPTRVVHGEIVVLVVPARQPYE